MERKTKNLNWSSWRDLFRDIGGAGSVAGVLEPDPASVRSPLPGSMIVRGDQVAPGHGDREPEEASHAGPGVGSPGFRGEVEEGNTGIRHYDHAA